MWFVCVHVYVSVCVRACACVSVRMSGISMVILCVHVCACVRQPITIFCWSKCNKLILSLLLSNIA